MKKIITYIACMIVIANMMSCAYNNEEELYPEICDTTNVTYQAVILPLVTQKCYECHSGNPPSSGIDLTGHASLKAMADAGTLVGAIRHLSGFSPMPKDRGFLPECEILKIEKWVSLGSPDN